MINPAPHKVVGAGFYIARLTTKTCLPSVGICLQIQLRKLKPPGGVLVLQVLVQVCPPPYQLKLEYLPFFLETSFYNENLVQYFFRMLRFVDILLL